MRKILFAALLLTAGVAVLALAANDHEAILTADGGGSMTSKLYFNSGPQTVDVASNGTATIHFIWFYDNAAGRDSAHVAVIGPNWVLRDWTGPRTFSFQGGPDSFYVDVTSATEVIVSW